MERYQNSDNYYQMKFQLSVVVVATAGVVAFVVVVEFILLFVVLVEEALVVGVEALVSATTLELALEAAFEVPVEPEMLEVLVAELGTKLVADAPVFIIVGPKGAEVEV
jgi:hypothetical protein